MNQAIIDLDENHIGKVISFITNDPDSPTSTGEIAVTGQLACLMTRRPSQLGKVQVVMAGGPSFLFSPQKARETPVTIHNRR